MLDSRLPAYTLLPAILVTEPARVSEVNTGRAPGGSDLIEHAARCGTTPSGLRRALRGDLDAIVGRALQKDPAHRYPSVTAFADDLRRVLDHQPVSARADTLLYRASRFTRRNIRGVVTLGVVTLLVDGLIAFHAMRLATERDRAQREAAEAVKVSEVLMGLLTSADPYAIRTAPGEPPVRALLDGFAEQVQKELVGQPELQSELMTMMGRTYRRLAVYDKAQQLLEQALVAGQAAFGPEDVRVAQSLNDLGVVFAEKGDYAAAAERLEQALEMRRRLLGRDHADVAITLVELGRVYQDQGSNDRAEPVHREALAVRRRVLGEGHRVRGDDGHPGTLLRRRARLHDHEQCARRRSADPQLQPNVRRRPRGRRGAHAAWLSLPLRGRGGLHQARRVAHWAFQKFLVPVPGSAQ